MEVVTIGVVGVFEVTGLIEVVDIVEEELFEVADKVKMEVDD
jgi:hypothetical protein